MLTIPDLLDEPAPAMHKLVLLCVMYDCAVERSGADEIEINEALTYWQALGVIVPIDGARWRVVGRQKKGGSEEDGKVARWMFARVRILVPSASEPHWRSWTDDIRKMRELDGRTSSEIVTMFDFANKHHFWSANVLSPQKLRKQWSRLTIEREREGRGNVRNGRYVTAAERILGSTTERVVNGEATRSDQPIADQTGVVVRQRP